MKVLVVSGFLGAGKTTFIEELARRTGRDFVVYENEYGQADLDADKLRTDAELEVWASAENCICCTGKQDFASSVLTISNTLDPEYLVVEPTGVAKLSSIMANLRQIACGYDRIRLLAPVCICDAQAWERQRQRAGDIFDDQLGCAATVVLSKLGAAGMAPAAGAGAAAGIAGAAGSGAAGAGAVGAGATAAVADAGSSAGTAGSAGAGAVGAGTAGVGAGSAGTEGADAAACAGAAEAEVPPALRAAAPHVEFVAQRYDALPDAWWNRLLSRELDAAGEVHDAASAAASAGAGEDSEPLDRFALAFVELPTPSHLAWVLDALVAGVFGDISRAKGIVRCGNQNVRFDCVDRAWAMTGAPDEEEVRAVFIGSGLHRPWLREVFVPALQRDKADIEDAHEHECEQDNECEHEHGREHDCRHEHDCGREHDYGHACEHDHGRDQACEHGRERERN